MKGVMYSKPFPQHHHLKKSKVRKLIKCTKLAKHYKKEMKII